MWNPPTFRCGPLRWNVANTLSDLGKRNWRTSHVGISTRFLTGVDWLRLPGVFGLLTAPRSPLGGVAIETRMSCQARSRGMVLISSAPALVMRYWSSSFTPWWLAGSPM